MDNVFGYSQAWDATPVILLIVSMLIAGCRNNLNQYLVIFIATVIFSSICTVESIHFFMEDGSLLSVVSTSLQTGIIILLSDKSKADKLSSCLAIASAVALVETHFFGFMPVGLMALIVSGVVSGIMYAPRKTNAEHGESR